MNDFSVDMNEYLPLRDVVFNTLRKAILKGELKPGERLMEIALAQRLGVSRTPVREAMRKLELEGLVVMIPRRGNTRSSVREGSQRCSGGEDRAGESLHPESLFLYDGGRA